MSFDWDKREKKTLVQTLACQYLWTFENAVTPEEPICNYFSFVFTSQDSELALSTKSIEAEIKNEKIRDEMEINKAKQLAVIEVEKFENMVKAIGPETIQAIANAGPQMQVIGG